MPTSAKSALEIFNRHRVSTPIVSRNMPADFEPAPGMIFFNGRWMTEREKAERYPEPSFSIDGGKAGQWLRDRADEFGGVVNAFGDGMPDYMKNWKAGVELIRPAEPMPHTQMPGLERPLAGDNKTPSRDPRRAPSDAPYQHIAAQPMPPKTTLVNRALPTSRSEGPSDAPFYHMLASAVRAKKP